MTGATTGDSLPGQMPDVGAECGCTRVEAAVDGRQLRGCEQPVFRFAPSPNGRLHLGHALSALTSHEMARRLGGRFLLRIEDIDTGRSRPEYIDGIYHDLEWLGLTWETPVLRQSEHFAHYRSAADRLEQMGALYPCFATRAEILAAAVPGATDPDGAAIYPGLHRGLAADDVAWRRQQGQPFALRLDMQAALVRLGLRDDGQQLSYRAFDGDFRSSIVACEPARWGDAVIVRKDVPASYHLAVVLDDARQGITHVVRGRDLEAATDLHRVLQCLLGISPPVYHHHRLQLDASGRKLAKRHRDTSLADLRAAGVTVADVRRLVGLAGD